MLIKLLKYDLKYMIKNMLVFYILSIVFAITTRILFEVKDTIILNIMYNLSLGCMFSMLASTFINTLMRSWVRFRDSLYKDESYLTHTLPVSKNNIYDSKFLLTLIFGIVGFIVIILSLFIVYYSKDNWLALKALFSKIASGLNFSVSFGVISVILVIFLEVFNALQCGYFGIILGHKQNNNKIGLSVLFGLIMYMISQTILLIALFIVGLFNTDIKALFNNNVLLSSSTFKLLVIVSIIIYFVLIIVISLICKKILNKGVNIE